MTDKNRTHTLSGCKSNTRLTWFLDHTDSSWVIAKTMYFYFDNIRVSLK